MIKTGIWRGTPTVISKINTAHARKLNETDG